MQVGSIVKTINSPNGKAGVVRSIEGRKAVVRWTLGSGWVWNAPYDIDELEAEIKR